MKVLFQDKNNIDIFLNDIDTTKYNLLINGELYTELPMFRESLKKFFDDLKLLVGKRFNTKCTIIMRKMLNIGLLVQISKKVDVDLFDDLYDFKVLVKEDESVFFSFKEIEYLLQIGGKGFIYHSDGEYYYKFTEDVDENIVDKLFEFGKLEYRKFIDEKNDLTDNVERMK